MARLVSLLIAVTLTLVFGQTPDPTKWRAIDGYGNNVNNPLWGTPGRRLQRYGPALYGDGVSSDRLAADGGPLPSPRAISNIVHAQLPGKFQPPSARGYTDFLTYWGQFIDHDLDLTGGPKGSAIPLQPDPIPVPKGDPFFDPLSTGNATIAFYRSIYDNTTSYSLPNGTAIPREQISLITGFLDGSQVYGSDNLTAATLRTFTGGFLKTSLLNGLELPPLNTFGIPNANDAHKVNDSQLYLLGDVRGNENPALTSLHTLFIREHNRRARELSILNSTLTDEEIYQEARRWVIAHIQHITFDEYYPVTIGDAPLSYPGYNGTTDPTIFTEFSTGAFRYGHSEVSEWIWRVDNMNKTIPNGHLHLRDSYFNSPTTIGVDGIEPILLGMAYFTQNAVDLYFIDDLLNYLFGIPGSGGFDLTALNTKRGRDHGLPGINTYRSYYGLDPWTSWAQIHPDPEVQRRLSTAYKTIDDCDVYVCGLAEFHDYAANNGNLYANVGDTFTNAIRDQYNRIREADRFWYENGQWSDVDLAAIKATTLKDIIVRNTPIQAGDLQCFVMAAADGCGKPITPPPPVFSTNFDFNITLAKKTPAHPLYGKGHPYGLVVNGVEGATITIQKGKSYRVWAQISCAHSLIFSTLPDLPNDEVIPGFTPSGGGDDGGFLTNAVARNFGCISQPNREMAIVVVGDVPDYIFYQCDFHPGMGGIIKVLPATGTGVSLVLQPMLLLSVLVALLF